MLLKEVRDFDKGLNLNDTKVKLGKRLARKKSQSKIMIDLTSPEKSKRAERPAAKKTLKLK